MSLSHANNYLKNGFCSDCSDFQAINFQVFAIFVSDICYQYGFSQMVEIVMISEEEGDKVIREKENIAVFALIENSDRRRSLKRTAGIMSGFLVVSGNLYSFTFKEILFRF
jgi:hypothetical protein